MLVATQIRAGMIILLEGTLYRIMGVTHLTPGNKRGIIQTQLRNLTSGNQEEKRFGTDERVERAYLEQVEMEFLYAEGDHFHFMHTETYEQVVFNRGDLGSVPQFLLVNAKVTVEYHDGRAIGVSLPQIVVLTVVEAEPTVKNATVTSQYKQATLATGLTMKVPNFIQAGEQIRVDTTTGEYVERA